MIFFDLDDTLFDFKKAESVAIRDSYYAYPISNLSEDDFYEVWCEIGKKHFERYLQGKITFEQLQTERVKEVFNSNGMFIDDKEAQDYYQVYLRYYENNWKAFDDVVTCLNKLDGYRLGIISNGDLTQQKYKLEKIGILDYFEIVVTSGETGIAKPDLRIFQIACEKARVAPSDCFYVGDNLLNDILPCKQLKMKGVWLNRRNESTTVEDITMIQNLSELESFIPLIGRQNLS